MSVLDVFYVLFKSDTSDLKKGTDEAKKHLGEFDKTAKGAGEATNNLGSSLLGIAGQISSVFAGYLTLGAIRSNTMDAIGYNAELARTSNFLGLNITQLAAWKDAIKTTGYSAEAFEGTIKRLALEFIHLNMGDQVPAIFDKLIKLSEDFAKMPRDVAMSKGLDMGIDEGTMAFLLRGPDAVRAMIAEMEKLGLVKKKDGEQSQKLASDYEKLDIASRKFWTGFTDLAFPSIQGGIALLTHLLNVMSDGTKGLAMFGSFINKSIGLEDEKGNPTNFWGLFGKKKQPAPITTGPSDGIRLDGPAPQLKSANELMKISQEQLNAANNSTFTYAKPPALGAGSRGDTNVTIGDITVQTQSTDAEGISREVSKSLADQVQSALGNSADGIAY